MRRYVELLIKQHTLIQKYLACSQNLREQIVLLVVQEDAQELRENQKEMHKSDGIEQPIHIICFILVFRRDGGLKNRHGYEATNK